MAADHEYLQIDGRGHPRFGRGAARRAVVDHEYGEDERELDTASLDDDVGASAADLVVGTFYKCSGSRHTDSFAGRVRVPNRQAGVRCPLSSSVPHSQCERCTPALRSGTTASGKTELLQRVDSSRSPLDNVSIREASNHFVCANSPVVDSVEFQFARNTQHNRGGRSQGYRAAWAIR